MVPVVLVGGAEPSGAEVGDGEPDPLSRRLAAQRVAVVRAALVQRGVPEVLLVDGGVVADGSAGRSVVATPVRDPRR